MCTELYFYFLHKNDSYKIRFTFQYLAMDYLPFPSGFPISKSVSFQPFSFFFWQFSLSFGWATAPSSLVFITRCGALLCTFPTSCEDQVYFEVFTVKSRRNCNNKHINYLAKIVLCFIFLLSWLHLVSLFRINECNFDSVRKITFERKGPQLTDKQPLLFNRE
jgi:hypothetical protein